MSKKILGVFPKSGAAMLKDAIGQFKGIVAQIKEGVKKVEAKVSKNISKSEKMVKETAVKVEKIATENDVLIAAVEEAIVVADNLESMLSGKIMTLPTEEQEASETEEPVVGDEAEESSE